MPAQPLPPWQRLFFYQNTVPTIFNAGFLSPDLLPGRWAGSEVFAHIRNAIPGSPVFLTSQQPLLSPKGQHFTGVAHWPQNDCICVFPYQALMKQCGHSEVRWAVIRKKISRPAIGALTSPA